ncbi:MAG: hypothetical protein GEV05_18860 [Betaproteobacteria bacterium]|nr:hypothetical protein [Betaproteobacteria bacterium]
MAVRYAAPRITARCSGRSAPISIGRLIESEFLVDSQQSVEHASQASEFGYRSAHYIIRLSEKRSLLREWENFTDLKAEIQVRTVLQHAWAAISHKLQYKREGDVPASLRRKLFRLSALFELADDEFVSLRDASGNLTRAISNQLSAGDTRLPLDYLSVGQFMTKSPIVAELSAIAAEIGFDFDEPEDPNLSDSDALSDLIELAGLAEITTLTELESLLADAIRWANEYLQEQFIESGGPAKHSWYVTQEFVCELILIRAKVERLRVGNLLRLGWDRRIAKRVFDVAQTFQPNGA